MYIFCYSTRRTPCGGRLRGRKEGQRETNGDKYMCVTWHPWRSCTPWWGRSAWKGGFDLRQMCCATWVKQTVMTSSNGNISVLLALCAGNSPVTGEFPAQCQWRGALMFLICAWIYGWVNNREAGDFRRIRDHYDVTVMPWACENPVAVWDCCTRQPGGW